MRIKDWMKKIRDSCVEKVNPAVTLPDDFSEEDQKIIRKHFLFSGTVQHVGFRMEMYLMAERIGLTGWAKNLTDGRVEAEVQGTAEQIAFLVKYLESVKRIHISNYEETEIAIQSQEEGFLSYYS